MSNYCESRFLLLSDVWILLICTSLSYFQTTEPRVIGNALFLAWWPTWSLCRGGANGAHVQAAHWSYLIDLLEWFEVPVCFILFLERPTPCADLYKYSKHLHNSESEPQTITASRSGCRSLLWPPCDLPRHYRRQHSDPGGSSSSISALLINLK